MKVSLCTVAFSVAGFVRDWNHCDQVADYLAMSVSIDQPESFRHGNLLSSIINEILETVHLSDRPDSLMEIEILTDSPFVHVVMHALGGVRKPLAHKVECINRIGPGGSGQPLPVNFLRFTLLLLLTHGC